MPKKKVESMVKPEHITFEQFCETHASAKFANEKFKYWLTQENMNGAKIAMTQTPEAWYIIFSGFLKIINKPPRKAKVSALTEK